MTDTPLYCLIQDGDGHWYLCPVERRKEAIHMLWAIEAYWDDPGWHKYVADPPPDPDFVERIDNPFVLAFSHPNILGIDEEEGLVVE